MVPPGGPGATAPAGPTDAPPPLCEVPEPELELPLPPPIPAPPLPVEVVPGEAGVVAGGAVEVEVVVGVEGAVAVGVVVVLGAVAVVVGVLEVEEVVVEVLGAGLHCWLASWPTVETPWSRFWRSVGLIDAGSWATEWARLTVTFETVVQSPDCSAEEIWPSWSLIVLDWLPESRPEPPPHAATINDTASPRPPARMARDRERIRA